MATEKQQFYSDTLLQTVRKHDRFLPEKPSNLTRNNQALSQ